MENEQWQLRRLSSQVFLVQQLHLPTAELADPGCEATDSSLSATPLALLLLVATRTKLFRRDGVQRGIPASTVSLLRRDRVQHKGKVALLLAKETVRPSQYQCASTRL